MSTPQAEQPSSTGTPGYSSKWFEIMKEGVPLIRRIDSLESESEVTMCMAFLDDNLRSIRFVRQENDQSKEFSVASLSLPLIERIAHSCTDRHAIALMVPSESMIMELIFASEEDWTRWYSGLKRLVPPSGDEPCIDGGPEIDQGQFSQNPGVVQVMDGMEVENMNLKEALSIHKNMILDLSSVVIEKGRQISHLKQLLDIRDKTIAEQSNIIESLINNQSRIASLFSHIPLIRSPTNQLAQSSNECLDPMGSALLKNSLRPKTSITSISTSFNSVEVIDGLENQLKQLDERKRQLQVLFEKLSGC